MVLVRFGYESQLFGILISATDISSSRLLPTFQYTLRLWGSNLDVSCFLSSGGGTASCSNATLHWWWWANRLRSQRPRHPKGSWPVLHEVPQIERVWHPAGHKVCSYMQVRNGMLTDLHAHLAQLLSMPARHTYQIVRTHCTACGLHIHWFAHFCMQFCMTKASINCLS